MPGPAVGDGVPAGAVRHREPPAADFGRAVEHVVVAALRLADWLGDVGDIRQAVGVELRPVPEHLDDVGARARLNRGSDSRLEIVGVDELDDDLGA